MRLRMMLMASLFSLALIGTLTGLLYYHYTSSEALERSIVSHLETTAISRAEHIATYLEQNVERLKLITSRSALRDTLKSYNLNHSAADLAKITSIVKDAKAPIADIERICVVGLNGTVAASTDESFCGRDVRNRDFFTEGLKSDGAWFVEEGGTIKLFVSGPFVLEGEVIGLGITVVSLDYLHNIVSQRRGMGETEEVLVAISKQDGSRIYLFERLFESDALPQASEDSLTAEPMKHALLGNAKTFPSTLDYRNVEVIATSQYIATGKMGLVAKIDRAEAFGIYQMRLIETLLLALLMAFAAALAASIVISRQVSKPIMRLTADVNRITRGELDIQLERSSLAEVQSLTDSLNRILASMKLAILRTGMSKSEMGLGEAIKAKEEAEQRYRLLYDSSADAIMTIEPPEWKFTAGNPATLKMFGVANEKEFASLGPGDLSPERQPDSQLSSEKAKKMIGLAMKNGSNSFEWMHRRYNGESFPATVLLTRVTAENKTFLQATVRDITERKKAEDKVIDFGDYLNKVINSIADPVFVKDSNFKFTLVNDALCEMLGLGRDDIIGKTLGESLPKNQMKHFLEVDKRVLETGQENLSEEQLTGKGGKVLTIITKKTRYTDKNRNKFVVGVIRDITERKNAEESLKSSSVEWKNTFDSLQDLIFIQDTDFRFVKANKAFLDFVNMSEKDLIGKKCYEVLHKLNRPWIKCPTEEALRDKKPHTEEVDDANIGYRLSVSSSPILNDGREVTGIVHIARVLGKIEKKR